MVRIKPCIICCGEGGDLDNSAEDDYKNQGNIEKSKDGSSSTKEKLRRFFLLLGRFLNEPDIGGTGDAGSTQKQSEFLISAGMTCCKDCSQLVESFCELYHQMKSIELVLYAKVQALTEVMFSAQGEPSRRKVFKGSLKKLKAKGDIPEHSTLDVVTDFNRDLGKKCFHALRLSYPRLTLHKLEPQKEVTIDDFSNNDKNENQSHSKVSNLKQKQLDDASGNHTASKTTPILTTEMEQIMIKTEVQDGALDYGRNDDQELVTGAQSEGGDYQPDKSPISSTWSDNDTERESKRVVCQECNKSFSNVYTLKTHVKSVHLQIRNHICDHCGKAFWKSQDLRRHVDSVHLRSGKHGCDQCERKFSCPRDLSRHVKSVHLKLKEHVCDQCGKGFVQQKSLKGHLLLTHNNVANLENVCDKCGKGFKGLYDLRRHMISVHLESGEHICVKCQKPFISSRELARHFNSVHLKIRKNSCKKCVKCFGTSNELKRHLSRMHSKLREPDGETSASE